MAALARPLAWALALALVLSCCPAPSAAELPPEELTAPTEATLPEETTEPTESTLPEETTAPTETTLPEETTVPETIPEETVPAEPLPEATQPLETLSEAEQIPVMLSAPEVTEPAGPGLYFGQLHCHTDISEGTLSPEDTFRQAAQTPDLDFFAVTDHSHSFDGHLLSAIDADGSTVSADWAAGKAAAEAVTTASFLGIFGYEMSWPANMQLGHISTFGTPGFQSWQQEAYKKYRTALTNYYASLSSVAGSLSRFNHPGTRYGTFDDFAYSENADRVMSLIDIAGGDRYYSKALDLGWHLAPSGLARTAVYAEALTEDSVLEALGSLRAYTTDDTDLEIRFTVSGHPMGSRLKKRHIGDTLRLSLTWNDPSDSDASQAEVITNGGRTAAAQTLSGPSGTLEFTLPPESGYYFLRITQSDGDVAVTAPIWLDAAEQLGISGLTCKTEVPVQNEDVLLDLDLYNREDVDLHITVLELLADGVSIPLADTLSRIPAESSITHPIIFSADCVGRTALTLRITGALEGAPRTYETALTVNFRRSEQVTAICVDGSHENAGLDDLTLLKQMAMDRDIRLTVTEGALRGDMLETCRLLMVTSPTHPFSGEFLQAAAAFADFGGSILVCCQGIQSSPELNRFLRAIGSSMTLEETLAEDPVTNGGEPSLFFTDSILRDTPWCSGISDDQVYRFDNGCTLRPGSGTPLVLSGSQTLLACETLSGGGTVFVSGCLFLDDASLRVPKNIWQEPYANRTIAEALLGIGGDALPLSTIAGARAASPGTPVRIRGYATTGTSNPRNTFPDMIYLQDDTGGIAVTAFAGEAIQQGAPLEVRGFAGENGTLKTGSWELLDADHYQYPPLEGSWDTLLDLSQNSHQLVQVEGNCLEIYCREDGNFAGCLLEDGEGRTVRVAIEEHIRNGSDGENPLEKMIRKNRTVRAVGLLHADEFGGTCIRVRNCEEVVWVPQENYVNPKTGDPLAVPLLLPNR